jgi:predicted ATPase/DNA-binding CsgD family transcriptional regulator
VRTGTPQKTTAHNSAAVNEAQTVGCAGTPDARLAFVGRRAELQELEALHGRTRLLTLVGGGGVGKSRLARRLVDVETASVRRAIWFIDVDQLSPTGDVWSTVADQLGLHAAQQSLPEDVLDVLRPKKLLLVLDNCDSAVEACANFVLEISRYCPGIDVLATSREPLGVTGEVVWVVPPLTMADSIRMFALVVQTRQPQFSAAESEDTWHALNEVCQHLDGSPLLIQAVAACASADGVVRLDLQLKAEQLLCLEDTTAVLPRHHSLAASLDWDWRFLESDERLLLSRLSVFAGGWTLDAAEAVCSDTHLPLRQVSNCLTRLVLRSMVCTDDTSEPLRYRMSDTVRVYARRLIADDATRSRLQRQHAEYLLQSVMPAEIARETIRVAERLYRDRDNLNSALAWAVEAHESDLAFKLAQLGFLVWCTRGLASEGRRSLGHLLASQVLIDQKPARALLGCLAGYLALIEADVPAAAHLAEEALPLQPMLAGHLKMLVSLSSGDHVGARALLESSPADDEQTAAPLRVAILLARARLALAVNQARRAAQLAGAAVSIARARQDRRWLARAVYTQGLVAIWRRQYAVAQWLVERAIATQTGEGDDTGLVNSWCALGEVELNSGTTNAAKRAFSQALNVAEHIGLRLGELRALEGIAAASAATQPQAALRLAAACHSMRQATGALAWPRARRSLTLRLQRGLGRPLSAAESNARAWESGVGWSELVDMGRQLTPSEASEPTTSPPDLLTPRERQVVELLAGGLSNQQIATRMAISLGTARAHVEHILMKLGFHSRAQVALWALREERLIR